MTALKVALGTLALISYALMFFLVVRFFDETNLVNGIFMVGSWLATIGLCWATDCVGRKKNGSGCGCS